jgi:hypothetical protein
MAEAMSRPAPSREALKKSEEALYACYQYSGADAGDKDDFHALVNKTEAVPEAVLDMRGRWDAAEARVLSLETERASWKTAAEDQNTWLAAHNRAVAAFNVAIGDAQDAVLRAETLGKALRELIRAWRDYPGCYDESPEPDKEMEALCKNATAVLEGTP